MNNKTGGNSGRTSRKRKAPDKAPERQDAKTVVLPFPETDDDEEAYRILSERFPGWSDLDKDEKAETLRLLRAQRKRGAAVEVTLTRNPGGSGYSINPKGKNEVLALLKLQEAFSANSVDAINARANELLNYLGSVGGATESRYNAALSFVESMKPQDQAEALLLTQMYCTHDATLRALCQIGNAEWAPQVQTFGNLAVKLLRVSQGQMETLARMRRGGEQVIRHVHLDNRGGQAVIAENVHTQGGRNEKLDEQPHATGPAGIGPALLGSHPEGNGVPISGGEGAEALPDAWWNRKRCA